jgi:hypothetical protein
VCGGDCERAMSSRWDVMVLSIVPLIDIPGPGARELCGQHGVGGISIYVSTWRAYTKVAEHVEGSGYGQRGPPS